jgi:hypothetical protein
MSLQDFADLGEAIGGGAVVITLIYLAIQLRRGRVELARQNARELLRHNNEVLLRLSENSRLMEIHIKAQTDFDALSDEDKMTWVVWLFTWTASWEQGFLDLPRREISGIELDQYAEGLALVLRTPGGRTVWTTIKSFFSAESVAALDRQIERSNTTQLERFTGSP